MDESTHDDSALLTTAPPLRRAVETRHGVRTLITRSFFGAAAAVALVCAALHAVLPTGLTPAQRAWTVLPFGALSLLSLLCLRARRGLVPWAMLAIMTLATLAVAERPGSDRGVVLEALESFGGVERVHFLDAPLSDVSSSRAREQAAAGEPIERLVGADVAEYVAEHALYGTGAGARAVS